MAKFFKLQEHGTTFEREIVGGVTTFLAMSYIIFVQPGVLSVTGMNFQAVMTATSLAAAASTLLMGLVANYLVALAPGMGENFFFAYALCGAVPLFQALGKTTLHSRQDFHCHIHRPPLT